MKEKYQKPHPCPHTVEARVNYHSNIIKSMTTPKKIIKKFGRIKKIIIL
jgi:hypothetical protein